VRIHKAAAFAHAPVTQPAARNRLYQCQLQASRGVSGSCLWVLAFGEHGGFEPPKAASLDAGQ
jgi:hypothetical protein